MTAVVTGILFILSIFIAPLVLGLFTPSVTAAALIIVGVLMVSQLREVNWKSTVVGASVFMTVIMMILSYSISIGIAWGFLTYSIGTIAKGKYREMGIGIWILAIIFIRYLFFGL